ncbi:MAG TPA: condensation domain-containing protein, partial [Thermoanaerobaculia bacterium]
TQVKISGHRVELGEIESALERHPRVRSAVAAAVGPRRGPRRLVAYVVGRGEDGGPPAAAELREYLRERLPEPLVPAAFVSLPALPLTANGKVDRGALPDPEAAAAGGGTARTAAGSGTPRTALEAQLAGLWEQLLGRAPVGRDDSLFDLGGNSLSAIQLLARVRDALGVEVPLRTLFDHPTVAGLAAGIEVQRRGGAGAAARPTPGLPSLVPDPALRHVPFPLTEVQEAYWIGRGGLFELGNVASHSYSEVEFRDLDLPRLERAWQRLIERHDMLRAVVLGDGTQRVLAEVPPYRFGILDLRGVPAAAAAARLAAVREEMSHQVLPADRWPLFEVRASLLDAGRIRVHCSIDILLIDAWSARLLARELSRLYRDPAFEPPPLGLCFRDYALAESAFQGSEIFERARDYWRHRVETLPPAPELPFQRAPGTLQRPQFRRRGATLERAAWSCLQERAAGAGLTPSGALLAAFAEVLRGFSKSPRFTLNLTTFNRLPLHPQVDQVVGDFTSLTLLEVAAGAGLSFERRAHALQRQLWQDLEHRHFGGVRMLRELARAHGRTIAAPMPVVFTSTLLGGEPPHAAGLPAAGGLPDGGGGAVAPGETAGPALLGEEVYGISQTPQVLLDHQVGERDGTLIYNWDAVEELFPAGLLDAMFAAYGGLLERLAAGEEAWQP